MGMGVNILATPAGGVYSRSKRKRAAIGRACISGTVRTVARWQRPVSKVAQFQYSLPPTLTLPGHRHRRAVRLRGHLG